MQKNKFFLWAFFFYFFTLIGSEVIAQKDSIIKVEINIEGEKLNFTNDIQLYIIINGHEFEPITYVNAFVVPELNDSDRIDVCFMFKGKRILFEDISKAEFCDWKFKIINNPKQKTNFELNPKGEKISKVYLLYTCASYYHKIATYKNPFILKRPFIFWDLNRNNNRLAKELKCLFNELVVNKQQSDSIPLLFSNNPISLTNSPFSNYTSYIKKNILNSENLTWKFISKRSRFYIYDSINPKKKLEFYFPLATEIANKKNIYGVRNLSIDYNDGTVIELELLRSDDFLTRLRGKVYIRNSQDW